MNLLKKLLGGNGAQKPETELTRNEQCWCGSGEKYKRCHMERDLVKDRREAAACRRNS